MAKTPAKRVAKTPATQRLDVKKTYKLYIGGAFPRSESGRTFIVNDSEGQFLANAALASRKDLRDAVVAARSAYSGWSSATAFNRGQVLYRVAEMMDARRDQFINEIISQEGATKKAATAHVDAAIDLWVWYAGWCDKISAINGATNPVSGPFYNFTVPESIGVVGMISEQGTSLIGLVAGLASIIATGNSVVVIASEDFPLSAITLAEVIATSDVPAGVINILTGKVSELAPWMASHMDIDAMDITGASSKLEPSLRKEGAENLKRIHRFENYATPNRLLAFMEQKTIWHTVGI